MRRPLISSALAACLLSTVYCLLPSLPAQQAATAAPAASQKPLVFKSSTELVVETVTVLGPDGKPVSNLSAKDFTVTEDNVPETIAFCEFQHLATTPPPPDSPLATPTANAAAPTTANQIAPESAVGNAYQNRRLIVLYFDLTAMPVADQLRSLQAAQKFVNQQMQPSDLIAVMAYEGAAVKVKHTFTGDKSVVLQTLNDLTYSDVLGFDESTSDAATADTGSAFGQDDSEFNIFNTNRQLAAMQTAVNMLSPISEKKVFIYFSSGLTLQGLDNQAQLASTENAAIRANVSFFPIDARGLIATPPMGDASVGSSGGQSMYTGGAAAAMAQRLERSQDTLYALAGDTGGKPLFDTNDLGTGIVRAEQSITDYYLIGYYTTNPNKDGSFRRVKVTYNGDPHAKLNYRSGYYMAKTFAKFTAADKERQLEDALMLPDPITDLTLELQVNYFELDSAQYFIPIAVKVPGSELALAKAGGAQRSHLDFIGEVKDQYGTTITNLRDNVDMKLTDATAAQLSKSPVEFTAGFTTLPGIYKIKVLVRDAETGRIGTYIADFTIPNLAKVTGPLPLSTLVLSHQKVPLVAALYNAKKNVAKDAEQQANPMVQNGDELLPSVTNVFTQDQTLYAFAQAYERPAPAAPGAPPAPAATAGAKPALPQGRPLIAYLTFFKDTAAVGAPPIAGAKVFEAQAIAATTFLGAPSYAVPVNLSLDLTKVPPGRYVCQLTVLDPTGHRTGFSRAAVWILKP